ncbi:MAG TPA: NAD-dependent epimerase/dehydratase family protein [Ignavibacteria bacterium]
MKTILLTGITGFLGANLLEAILAEDYTVIGLKRSTSDIWRIKEFLNDKRVKLIDIDKVPLDNIFAEEQHINILIHSAWGGVQAEDRNSITKQLENFNYAARLYNLSIKAGVNKIISLGSQAEYGQYEGRVDEDYPCKPTDAYGMAKIFTSRLLQTLAEQSNTKWFWIRLFSLFGPKEDCKWLLPFAIYKMINNEDINLTKCEQRYDYLYVKDFCKGIILLLNSVNSDIYNLSSNKSIQLKEILFLIKENLKSESKLNFGALEYRNNQVMHMEGDSTKFYKKNNFANSPFIESLIETTNYYKNKKTI